MNVAIQEVPNLEPPTGEYPEVEQQFEPPTIEDVSRTLDIEPDPDEEPISDEEWTRRRAAHLRRKVELERKVERLEQQYNKCVADLEEEERIGADLQESSHCVGLLRFLK